MSNKAFQQNLDDKKGPVYHRLSVLLPACDRQLADL